MKFVKKNLKWITILVLIVMLISLSLLKYFLLKQEDKLENDIIPIEELTEVETTKEEQEPIKKRSLNLE